MRLVSHPFKSTQAGYVIFILILQNDWNKEEGEMLLIQLCVMDIPISFCTGNWGDDDDDDDYGVGDD